MCKRTNFFVLTFLQKIIIGLIQLEGGKENREIIGTKSGKEVKDFSERLAYHVIKI